MLFKFWYPISFCTLLRKEIRRFTRIWGQTIIPPLITITLYFVIFGQLVGGKIGSVHGFRYIQYIAPGLIMMAVINNSYANVVSSVFGMRFQKSIEELLVAPLPNYLLLSGFVFGGMVRGLSVGALVTILALFFTHLSVHSFFILILIVPLTSLLFSLAGFTNAVFARNFDDISIIPTFILTPLTYLGGIFYSILTLPPFWQKFSLFNPILYIVNTFRFAILGVSDVSPYLAILVIVICCLLLGWYNLYLLKIGKGLRT